VVGTLSAQVVSGQSAEFIVNQGHQFGEHFLMTVAPIDKHLNDLFCANHSLIP